MHSVPSLSYQVKLSVFHVDLFPNRASLIRPAKTKPHRPIKDPRDLRGCRCGRTLISPSQPLLEDAGNKWWVSKGDKDEVSAGARLLAAPLEARCPLKSSRAGGVRAPSSDSRCVCLCR